MADDILASIALQNQHLSAKNDLLSAEIKLMQEKIMQDQKIIAAFQKKLQDVLHAMQKQSPTVAIMLQDPIHALSNLLQNCDSQTAAIQKAKAALANKEALLSSTLQKMQHADQTAFLLTHSSYAFNHAQFDPLKFKMSAESQKNFKHLDAYYAAITLTDTGPCPHASHHYGMSSDKLFEPHINVTKPDEDEA